MANITLRNSDGRIRRLRESLKLSKQATMIRASLTIAQYSWLEQPTPRARGSRVRSRVRYVPEHWVQRLAIALGTTTDYIATGKADVRVIPPNHPAVPMLAELARERKKRESAERRAERNAAKSQALIESLGNELRLVKQMADAALAMRKDDALYIREQIIQRYRRGEDPNAVMTTIEVATEAMQRGEPARPEHDDALRAPEYVPALGRSVQPSDPITEADRRKLWGDEA